MRARKPGYKGRVARFRGPIIVMFVYLANTGVADMSESHDIRHSHWRGDCHGTHFVVCAMEMVGCA